jgi:predicted enzyme related to lactoylglutathione lyase
VDARITAIGIVVKNQADALDFYTNKVGFEKKTDNTAGNYRYVTVGPRGQDLELALTPMASSDPNSGTRNWKPGTSPPVVMQTDDCRGLYDKMKSRGVPFIQELKEYPWGISATFTDPDGNIFSINQLPKKGSTP